MFFKLAAFFFISILYNAVNNNSSLVNNSAQRSRKKVVREILGNLSLINGASRLFSIINKLTLKAREMI